LKGIKTEYIYRERNGVIAQVEDQIAIEEPLEMRILTDGIEKSISVTMRTPTNDAFLAAGFLFTEGIISNQKEIKNITSAENIVTVELASGTKVDVKKVERNFYTTSSCGVCGKSSIDSINTNSQFEISTDVHLIQKSILFGLQNILKEQQSLFSLTGGIHAAALFDFTGKLISLQEDVGRHNALDKLIGDAMLKDSLPLKQHLLLLSGRASFELIQKATMAGIPIIAAIGAPSSLAIELAKENGHTLIGFLKKKGFNIYCGYERIEN